MFRIPIVVSLGGLWLTAGFFITEAAGQERQSDGSAQTPNPRIVWQQELEGGIRYRSYIGPNSGLRPPQVFLAHEPDVGISSDSARANPLRMVSTFKSVYLFDEEGRIERRVPLRWDSIPDDLKALTSADPEIRGQTEETLGDYIKRGGDKRFFIRELPTTDPKGRFYLIRTKETRGYDGIWTTSIRAFNVDGSLRFELRNKLHEKPPISLYGEFYLSPDGEYMVVFDNGWGENPFASFDLYETATGARLRHVSEDDFRQYDFEPLNLSFSEDGHYVMLKGSEIGKREDKKTRTLLIFDGQGNLIQPPEGPRAKLTTDSQTQHSMKQAIYRQLVDPQAPLGARPKEVRDVKMLPDRNRGVYTSGNTLYLFELHPSP